MKSASDATHSWPHQIFEVLRAAHVRQVAHVPDAGHTNLIECCESEPSMKTVTLTTEEEGVALCAGAWLGGQRSALLMQSSGVGNCVNMLSLVANARFPLLMLVTMRGEWGEFNPWQVPMGRATPIVLNQMGVDAIRLDDPDEARTTVQAACTMAFGGGAAIAVLLSQRLIGAKDFNK